MSAGEAVRIDLDALRAEFAASPGAGRLQPLGLGRVIDGEGALDELARAVADFPRSGEGVVVLAAATPMRVAGWDLRAEATEVLGRGFAVDWVTLGPADGQVHADEETVAAARKATAGAGCVVTIGSGTITDIGKVSTSIGTPLVAVQTATSVNGYADSFSVLLRRGVKRTSASRWPDTLLIDPAVLRAAPPELNRAGVGDLMAMFTATADWYLASAVSDGCHLDTAAARGEPHYNATVAGIVRAHGGRLLALAAGLAGRLGRDGRPGRTAGRTVSAEDAAGGRPGRARPHPDPERHRDGRGGLDRPGVGHGACRQPPAGDGGHGPGGARQLPRHAGRRGERRRGRHLGARAAADRRGSPRPARPDPRPRPGQGTHPRGVHGDRPDRRDGRRVLRRLRGQAAAAGRRRRSAGRPAHRMGRPRGHAERDADRARPSSPADCARPGCRPASASSPSRSATRTPAGPWPTAR